LGKAIALWWKLIPDRTMLSSPRAGHRRPRVYQFCSALIANKGALIGHQTELDIEADTEVLVREAGDYPVATRAPGPGFHPAIIGGFVRLRDMTGHREIPCLHHQPSYRYIYWYISQTARRTGEERKSASRSEPTIAS
jgi:hypothetical protein